jgi:prepilin-type N-terminal cleavage/methylation domain-containing protein
MKRCYAAGFSLLEVIVALGILGGGLVAVLAMFAPLARVNGANTEWLQAAEAAAAVNHQLRLMTWAEAGVAMADTFYVNRTGSTVALATDPAWIGREEQRYFAVTVPVNPTLVGSGDPANLPWLAFNLRVRWPVAAGDLAAQHELVVPGSLHR